MRETIDYIIRFLLYDNREAAQQIGYTADSSLWANYRIVILPDRRSPLAYADGILYRPDIERDPEITTSNDTFVITDDILYNTFFFISRAEELLDTQRDEHGRFLARYSLLGQAQKVQIPIVDQYACLLLRLLNLPLPSPRLAKINLTHDVDILAFYRHLRGFLGGIKRGRVCTALKAACRLENDPAYTFPWLQLQDNTINAAQIYFLKASAGRGYDYPQYNLQGNDCQSLLLSLAATGAKIGLHASYQSGDDTSLLPVEKQRLQNACGVPISCSRWHYLRSQQPDDFQVLADSGITDDYTMGFPDQAGFRLGTTRPVRWINPHTCQLTPLTLHHLTIMDCTLSNAKYMNLNEEAALATCISLIGQVRSHAGELTLLWHNSNLGTDTWHKNLYTALLQSLRS